jgi:hypothetical protein
MSPSNCERPGDKPRRSEPTEIVESGSNMNSIVQPSEQSTEEITEVRTVVATQTKFTITLYDNSRTFGAVAGSAEETWEQIAARLAAAAANEESGPYDPNSVADERAAKARLPAFGPHRLVEGAPRNRMSVEAVTLLAADVDHATQEEIDGIATHAAGRAVIVYGSPRDGMNGERRVRVVGLPSREMSAADADAARLGFAVALGFDVDAHGVREALGPERLFFVGGMAGLGPREFAWQDGAAWDVDALIASAPKAAPAAIVVASEPRAIVPRGENRTAAVSAIVEALGDWRGHEGRKSNLCAAIGGLMRRSDGSGSKRLCKDVIETWLAGLDEESGNRCATSDGVNRALAAWDKGQAKVTGADEFERILGDAEHAARIVEAIRAATLGGMAQWNTPTPANTVAASPIDTGLNLVTDRQNRPLRTIDNASRYIEQCFGNRIRYEAFADKITCSGIDQSYGHMPDGEWSDTHTTALTCLCERNGLLVSTETVDRAIKLHAKAHEYNVLTDFLIECDGAWDGARRVDLALSTYWGAADTPAARIASRVFLLSLAARGVEPGSKVDTCVTFVGPQGALKSSSLRALVGAPWFSDSPLPIGDKDAQQNIRGAWLWEFAENASLSRRESDAVKAYLSQQSDRFRPSYGHHPVRVTRQTCFVASVNPDGVGFLRDSTGNRRFPIVEVGRIDLDAIERDRVQLFGEAVRRIRGGERWWPDTADDAVLDAVRKRHEESDAWDDRVEAWASKQTAFALVDALQYGVGLDLSECGGREQARVAKCLRRLGYAPRDVKEPGGIVRKRWAREDAITATAGSAGSAR